MEIRQAERRLISAPVETDWKAQRVKTQRIIGGLSAGTVGGAGLSFVGWPHAFLALGCWTLIIIALGLFRDAVEAR